MRVASNLLRSLVQRLSCLEGCSRVFQTRPYVAALGHDDISLGPVRSSHMVQDVEVGIVGHLQVSVRSGVGHPTRWVHGGGSKYEKGVALRGSRFLSRW